MTALQRSTLATLAYFDLFDYPLTLAEVARFMYASGGRRPSGLSEVHSALGAVGAGELDGFHFLPGREAIVDVRKRRYRLAEPKFRLARRAAKMMAALPSVRFVAVCNSLAISNADTESDIDLFVVVRHGTLWSTRFAVVAALKAFGLRPTESSHADKLCMSFFVTERALDLSRVTDGDDDVYLRYWIASLIPIHDDGIGVRFFRANSWITNRLPAWRCPVPAPRRPSLPILPALRAAEPLSRALQFRMFPDAIRCMANHDSRVIVSDDMLKFHVNDRRAHFRDLFRDRLKDLGIDDL